MSRNKRKSLLPSSLLWRLTLVNVVMIGLFVALSGWAIYNTACFLAGGLCTLSEQRQDQFDLALFKYLWIFTLSTIILGSIVHFYLIRQLTRPLKKLTESTKRMKEGRYPQPIQSSTNDEVGQLISHFNDLIEQLKKNQQQRKDIVLDLSHEIRTPLSNLNGYLSALKNGVVQGDREMYRSLHGELQRLITMFDQLEQLKEWDYISEQTFTEKEPMDMQLIIRQSVDMFRWSAEKAGIALEVEADSGIVLVYDNGISQVIGNLLDNAFRYYEGTGAVTITGENKGSFYRCTVSGQGQPIPVENSDDVFERLYRVDPSRTRDRAGGTGLGLAISKEIIEHHKGEIGVETDGHFHKFSFTLPLNDESAE